MNINFRPLAPGDDLMKELSPPTELKPEPFNQGDFNNIFNRETPTPPPPPSSDDFVSDPQPEPEPEPPTDPPTPIDYKEQAKLMVAFLDGFQTLALPVAYQKAYFSNEEIERLKDLKKRMEQTPGAALLDSEDQEIYQKYVDCDQLTRNLPFTEKEVDILVNPLAAVMEKYRFTPGPETLLMGALFTVMAPRLAPLLITISK